MVKAIKNPFKRFLQKDAVVILCVCVLFSMVVGCGLLADNSSSIVDEDNSSENGSSQELECNCKDELYYFSNLDDQKYFFDDRLLNDWLHVGFDYQVQDDEIVRYINETNIFKSVDIRQLRKLPEEIAGSSPPYGYNYKRIYVNTKKKMTCMQLKKIICTLEESSVVAFANLAFWYWTSGAEKNKSMESFSNYFHVTVKNKEDLSDLYLVSQETNTCIIEQPEYLSFSSTYTLRTNKNSNGNALQMANYFAETGKFVLAGVEWLDGLRPELLFNFNE